MVPILLEAQTYYVAIIKGEVTYNGKPLKKRAKITPEGELRFGTPESYLKVSGPGGIFTFRAQEKDTRGEFVTALSQELFPTVKAKKSFAYSLGVDTRISYLFTPQSPPFWDQDYFLPDSLVGRAGDVYFAADGNDGLIISRAADKKGRVKVRKAAFEEKRPTKVFILMVNDHREWDRRIVQADSVAHLGAEVEYWPDSARATARPQVTLMTSYSPGGMVDRKPFQQEIRRQVKYIKPAKASDLLDDYDVQELFKEMFGVSTFPNDAWMYVNSLLKQ